MGGFLTALGSGAVQGFEQARQQGLERQFADEQNRRAQIGGFLSKIAMDETAHPYSRQAAGQEYLKLTQTPWNKLYKFDPNTLVAPAQPKQTTQAPGLAALPQPPAGVNVTPGQTTTQQMPAGVAGPPAQITGPPQISAPPAPPPGLLVGIGAGPVSLAAQPPQNIFMSPEEVTKQTASRTGATTEAQVGGQISARKQAIAGMGLEPETAAAFALGMPQVLGSYGRGDTLPAADAARQGIPMPVGIQPTDWIRVQRGKLGNIVGVFPATMPPAYAPTEHEGFVQVQQLDGTIKEVPVTSVTQKQLPTQTAQARPTAKVGEGKTVGGKSPTPAIMIAPPTAPGEQPRAIAVKPGSKVPTGAVTTAGLSSVSVPTAGTRTRSEFATGLIPAVDRAIVDVNHAAPKLGALKGRWNEFIAGRLGGGLDDDSEISSLRTEMGLLQTGMMVPHVGARGGVQLIGKFKSMIDSGKQDAPQLTAALKEMRKFLVTYAKEGQLKGWGNQPMDQTGGPPTQGTGDFFSQFGGTAR